MTPHERTIISLSLDILRAAMARASKERVDTVEVRLALRCLMPFCRERWPLTSYWGGASTAQDIGRSATCTASYNGICRQLRMSGSYPEDAEQ